MMGHTYAGVRKEGVIGKTRLNYMSPKSWRIMYLIKTNSVHHTSEKRVKDRSSRTPLTFLGYEVLVYAGKRWHKRRVNYWMLGYSLGEFTWNRRLALYKAKQLRKKNKIKK